MTESSGKTGARLGLLRLAAEPCRIIQLQPGDHIADIAALNRELAKSHWRHTWLRWLPGWSVAVLGFTTISLIGLVVPSQDRQFTMFLGLCGFMGITILSDLPTRLADEIDTAIAPCQLREPRDS